jgi:signal transduction histidine kinase
MSKRSKAWIAGAACLVLAQATACLVLPHDFKLIALSDVVQTILLLSGTLSMLPNVFRTRGRTRLFWILMTLGVASWFVYQSLWTWFEVIQRQEVPNPWDGDIILFLHIVPMMGAIALQPHTQQDDRAARLGALDFALLLVWWICLYVFTVIPWQYAHGSESAYSHNLNAIYLVEKLAFLAGLGFVWYRSKAAWKAIYLHWFGASLTYALSSYVANWAIAAGVYYTGSFYDVPLAVAMAWITVVGVFSAGAQPSQISVRTTQRYGVWVARLGMIAVFSLPILAILSMYDASTPLSVKKFRMIVSLAAMLLMGLLVFVKQHLLDRELLGLLREAESSFADLKRLQTQLVRSEKLASLGHLVGGAAHELNNPLTAMLGYSDLLSATSLDDPQRNMADKIGQQVRRTKTLVSSLLNFAQQTRTEKTVVDLNTLAQTALSLSQPQFRARRIEVQTRFAADLPTVLGDSNQLLQVCLHIANNALLSMAAAGGTLTVCSSRQDNLAVLEFSDNGSGFGELETSSDPFAAEPSVSGMGLTTCHGIIQEHGGKVVCQNRAEGGATFRVELPAASKGLATYATQDRPSEALAASVAP